MILLLHRRIDDLTPEQYEGTLARLPRDTVQRINQYRRPQDACAVLLGRCLVVEGLAYFGWAAKGFSVLDRLRYEGGRRPYLPGGPDFNISHSGSYVVCAVSDSGRVGVDVEFMRSLDVNSFRDQLTQQEWDTIEASDTPLSRFYHLWCQKESALKADGRGLTVALREAVCTGDGTVTVQGTAWNVSAVELAEEYCCCVASATPSELRVMQSRGDLP